MPSQYRRSCLFLVLLLLTASCGRTPTPSSQQAGVPSQPTPYPPPPTIPTRTPETSPTPGPPPTPAITEIWPTFTAMPTPVQPTSYAPGEALPVTFPSLVYAVRHSDDQPVQIWKLRYDQGLLLEELLFNLTDQTLDTYLGQDRPLGLGYGFVSKLSTSPDGQYTALTLEGEQGAIGTLVLSKDGHISFPLVPNRRGAEFLAWFPDSRRLVLQDDNYLTWVMAIDGTGLLQGPGQNVEDMVISPDGQWVLFATQSTQGLWRGTLNSDQSISVQQFAPLSGYEMQIFDLVLSPDGQLCVFSWWTNYNPTWGGQTGIMRADGTGQRPLGPADAFDFGLTWSSDSQVIAFIREENQVDRSAPPVDLVSSLWLLDVESGKERLLLSSEGQYATWSPHWLPDGSGLVFLSDRGGSANIWLIQPDGTGLQQLTQQGDLLQGDVLNK